MENDDFFLPDDPYEAFLVFQKKCKAELTAFTKSNNYDQKIVEISYANKIMAFLDEYPIENPYPLPERPTDEDYFFNWFFDFDRQVEKIVVRFSLRIGRDKSSLGLIVKFDADRKSAVRAMINAIREELDKVEIDGLKKRSLINKLNSFSNELEREFTSMQAFNAFVTQSTPIARKLGAVFKPITERIDRVIDIAERYVAVAERLTGPEEQPKITGPKSEAPKGGYGDLDDEIPF